MSDLQPRSPHPPPSTSPFFLLHQSVSRPWPRGKTVAAPLIREAMRSLTHVTQTTSFLMYGMINSPAELTLPTPQIGHILCQHGVEPYHPRPLGTEAHTISGFMHPPNDPEDRPCATLLSAQVGLFAERAEPPPPPFPCEPHVVPRRSFDGLQARPCTCRRPHL